MNRTTLTLLVVCAALALSHGPLAAPEGDSKKEESAITSLLSRVPAKNAAEQAEISSRLVELGPAAIVEVCARLIQPGTGDDTSARYALDGLSTYVHRPGAEPERLVVAGSYLKALEYADSDEVRAFLIRQLERVGREEALAALGEFISHPRLGEPAIRALVTIHTPGASKRLLKALPLVERTRQVTIINGLGTLRVEAAVQELLRHATSDDAAVRHAALSALANIGHPSTERVLARAARAESPPERNRGSRLYLLYAKRLAENGRKDSCARICRELITERAVPRESHVACAALSTLLGAVGIEASDDVLAAMKSEYGDVRGVAFRFALSIPGKDFTARCVELMRSSTPEVRAGMLDMLGRRGDRSALPTVREALAATLNKLQPEVTFAAIQAIGRLTEQPALTVLLAEIARASAYEKSRLFAFLEKFGGEQALGAVVDGMKSEDVRGAALDTLVSWPEPNALEPLLVVFRSEEEGNRRGTVLSAIMRLVARSGRSREAVLELYKNVLSAARSAPEKRAVIEGLGRLKSSGSLELVMSLFDEEDLRESVARAVVSIVRPRRSGRGALRGSDAVRALEKVIAASGDKDLRRDAEAVLKEIRSRETRR